MGIATPENKERNQKVYELRKQGFSNMDIAKKFDLTPQRVSKICHQVERKLAIDNSI